MNYEELNHKTGIIGEMLVKIMLNSIGINTGNVDKDTGTDLEFSRKRFSSTQIV
jgi:hypothetical protein